MNAGQQLTLWTIRLALALYAIVVVDRLVAREHARWRWRRLLWTAACALFLAHVACAFHYYHAWSHAHAFEHTAAETRRLLGWEFGYGIYFNHAFAVLWVADVLWWWTGSKLYRCRPRWLSHSIDGYMLFIALNGAVVFEDGPVRWFGIAFSIVLGLLLTWRVLAKKEVDAPDRS